MLLSRPERAPPSATTVVNDDSSMNTNSSSSRSNHRISLGGHTDIGAITLLFNVAGGLQILPSEHDNDSNAAPNWFHIRPQPSHALINIGDTPVEWTGGLLHSALHRVITAPGAQASTSRQSLTYLVRPMREASMRRLRSKVIPVVGEGQTEETRSVNEWTAWRAEQVMKGELKARSTGGRVAFQEDKEPIVNGAVAAPVGV